MNLRMSSASKMAQLAVCMMIHCMTAAALIDAMVWYGMVGNDSMMARTTATHNNYHNNNYNCNGSDEQLTTMTTMNNATINFTNAAQWDGGLIIHNQTNKFSNSLTLGTRTQDKDAEEG